MYGNRKSFSYIEIGQSDREIDNGLDTCIYLKSKGRIVGFAIRRAVMMLADGLIAKVKRGTWRSLNPVTRKPTNPKAYSRKKARREEEFFDGGL